MSNQRLSSTIGPEGVEVRTDYSNVPAAGERYTAIAQALHWVTMALMLAVLPLAWVGANIPDTDHGHEVILELHKSVGLTILIVVAIRLAWRALHPAPPLSNALAHWEKRLSMISHLLLYIILIGMPLTGYALSASSGHQIAYFNLFALPELSKDSNLQHTALLLHMIIGQWLVYPLILLHLAATLWHTAVKRDGVLERMLPPQKRAIAPNDAPTDRE